MRRLFVVLATIAVPIVVMAELRKARPADEFVDFIGVNTHLGYGDTVYREYEKIIRPRLLELGVRHIRDGTFNEAVARKYLDLGSNGIQVLWITDSSRVSQQAQQFRAALWAVEGMNEPDLQSGWVERLRIEQRALFGAVRTNAALAGVPVMVSSLANVRNSPGQLGNLEEFLDYGNMHPYAAGQSPSRHWGWGTSMEQAIAEAQKVSGRKAIVVTECGYHNRIAEEGHPGCSELAAGKYMPRLLLVYFNRGMKRAYLYEFADEKPDPEYGDKEQHFGLIRNDGSVKPAFQAVAEMIRQLRDPGPPFEPGSLDFELTGDTADLHWTLLQKRDGRFYVLLWRELDSWDVRTRKDVAHSPKQLSVRWAQAPVSVTRLSPAFRAAVRETLDSRETTEVQVADEVVMLEVLH